MLKLISFLFSILLFIVYTPFANLNAQNEECGTVLTDHDYNRILQTRQIQNLKASQQSDTLIQLPVQAHIFRSDRGTGGYTESELIAAIDYVNFQYAPANLEFILCDSINYFDSNEHLDFNRDEAEEICNTLDVPNVINIYFADRVYYFDNDGNAVFLCGYAYFSGPDRVVMKNSCANNRSTLAHELGHYLQLLHTHSSSRGKELVSGNNCSSAGDLLCDTPADPKLSGSTVNGSCVYTGNEQDPVGDYYTPDVTNIMSYSRKSCRDFFSPMQYDVVRNAAEGYRSYLQCPAFADIDADLRAVDTRLCIGESTTYQSISKGIIESYAWEFPGGEPSTSTDESPTVMYAETGTYSAQLIVSNQKFSDTIQYENYISAEEMDIQIDTIGNATFCEGESVTFQVGEAERTVWKIGSKISYKSSIQVTTADTITIRQISDLGCSDRDTIITSVLGRPEKQELSGESNVTIAQVYTYETVEGYADYLWNVTGGSIITDNGHSVEVQWEDTENSEICVSVVNQDGCPSDFECMEVSILTAVVDPKFPSDFLFYVYPNPTENGISFRTSRAGTVSLYDVRGSMRETVTVEKGEIYINLQSYAAGLYILKYTTEEGDEYTKKIIKL